MNLNQFLSDISDQGVKLWVEGEQLRVNAPKGFITPEIRELLVKHKAELIPLLQQQNRSTTDSELTITKVDTHALRESDNKKIVPLSFPQERIWFLSQLEPDNPFYNEQSALKLHGSLNIMALEQSINKIIDRHEILRTNFQILDEAPIQVIAENLTLNIPVLDLTGIPEIEKENTIQQLVKTEVSQPFDLPNSPLIRVTLLKLTELEHILLLTIHHIIFDGWSFGIFMQELATIYSAFCNNVSPKLPELPIQYADFAVWQKHYFQTEELQNQLNYWKQQLENCPPLLELPTDRPRPAIQTYQGIRKYLELPIDLSEAVVNLSKRAGVTLFMTLFAAFVILLYRYTNSDRIAIGTPIANRNRLELEQLIGFFVNTLVLDTDLSGNPNFLELLNRVQKVSLGAYANQDLPFEILVETLRPERNLSHAPLFQVMFILQNAPLQEIEVFGLKVSSMPVESVVSKFDLTLSMQNTTNGLVGLWEYNTDLFDDSTIERMMDHFLTLLAAIVADPQTPISQLPILTAAEQQQLLVEWNNTQTDYPTDKCLHQLFEAQVEKTPDAVAVVFENQQFTYQELNLRANQLANYLRSLGVSADVPVGICVERSLLMMVGILGILKAGGAYVPLDPEYPTQRLDFMLTDSSVAVLLTQQGLVDRLPKHQAQTVCLDLDWQVISGFNQENPATNVHLNNLAYVIYTSGSTGQPKGVAMNHLPLVNLMIWQQQHTTISPGGKTLQFAPISFDVSCQEMFSTWCDGGTLVLISEQLRRDPVALLGLLQEQAVERLFLPFVGLQQLAEVGMDSTSVLQLREIVTAGEQLQMTPAITRWLNQLRNCTLHNHYGPSESHVVTSFTLSDSIANRSLLPPIGCPIANSQIYILDSYLQPVPVGVSGELHIGGVGLARGYLNRPELTIEKFIPNPFSSEPDSRLYKTGDKARYLPDGNIEYLGRIDNQVKIRGFRIELGEIEAILGQYPQVKAAVVIVREDNLGDKRLVAYLVSDSEITPTTNELRQYLKALLPEYMVPSTFIFLETLPLTPNGKVDRRALPTPELNNAPTENYVAPRTPIEEILSHLFSQVLKLNQIGINDNFFEIGGHSLLATQLISRIRTHLQIELPLRTLFSAPTVAELASLIQAIKQQNLQLNFPPIVKRENQNELPLSYAQTRLWFIDQLQPNSALYNIPSALRIAGRLPIATLEKSLREIIQRHEVLRTNFITIDGEANQIINPENNGFLSLIDLQHLGTKEQEITVQALIQEQTIKPFDLAKDSLIRITLINKSETEHILIICMHHIISDGWSIGVFVQELAALYNADIQNQPSPLTPLPIQYADFAIWQREWLSGEVLETQLSYWKQQLADTPALLSLPTDRQRPAVQTYTGAHQKFALSSDLTEKLTQLSQEQGVTLFMTLLAGFNTLLYRYTGQSDIVVGSPIANRNHSEIEGLIGFFVNTLVLRTDLAENPSFTELIHRVKEVSLAAYTHQDLPFEMLVEAVAPSRDLSYSPLFQVMFVLQNAPLSELELSGLTLSPQELEMPIAKFDLTLSMENSSTGLVGWWEYNTDLFDGSTIERMIGHFQTLLAAIVENPQTPISQLPILTTTEQQQLLVEWNDTQTDYPIDQCLHQLFEQQVKKTPDAVAVIFEDQQLTYSQLNDRANQLAHYLRSLGVGADVLVGICVERSIDMIVGLLGILKAGGAYLPLDPDYPQERLQFMLDDAQVKVLLTQQRLLEKLNVTQENLICLDRDWQIIQQWSQNNPISEVLATNLAYVIYTSGSTGQPKGVLITHQGLLNLVFWHQSTFSIAPSDKATQLAGTAFDAAVWELWPYLSAGASVYLVTSDTLYSPTDLRDWLIAKEISITFVPTPLAEKLLLLEWNETSALRTMLVGGDRLHNYPSLSVPFSVVNNYGPTENTVVTTSGLVVPKAEEFSASPSIGRPIANTQVYILDSYLQPVPVGVPGELHIGGAGLARGYLNRKELTQEKFIPHPFDNNERVYKTGDLARYLPDGNIEYLGRIDNQVKIRGFRIELGEIEALLSQCPQVQAAVVIAREDIPGDKRLVAYIVPLPDTALTVSELREFLKAQVPEYMIPSAFVILESLPLTPNGKVDRRALPKPDFHSEQKDKYAAPRNSVEEILTQIWAEVLNLNSVGIYDNFFELGGYSLLAIQLVSRIRSQLQVEVPLQSLFAAPTVADLATIIAATLDSSAPITTDTQVDLEAEAVLDPSIQIENVPFTYTNEPKKIFLTGASGFLGSHLLYELLEQTQADVYCLIRSADEKQAYQKLLRQMESLQIWQEAFSSRIVPVVGDLSQNLLGLSRSNFQDLAAMIDVIYHNGALVNFVYPYSTLKPANVLGTQEVVRLASEIKLKPVHYVSTLSVFASPAYSGKIVLESDPLEHSKDMNNGYAQTKWVADRLMMLARDRGLPVCIYRPARILGHSQTGISPPDDFWSTFILGFIHLGMAIALDNAKDNIIPVDYMSRAIVHLSQQKESLGKAFHLLNSHYTPIADLYNWIRALGYPLKEISYEEWRSHLIRTNQTSSNKLLQSLVAMAPEPNNQTTEQNQPPEFDFTNALSGLAGTDLVFPAIEPDLIAKYLSNLLGKTDIFLKKQ